MTSDRRATFNPFDPEQQGIHHQMMAEIRAECPVAELASGMKVVSRYDDVRSLLQNPHMRNSHAARAPGVSVPPEDRFFFFEYDPPQHPPMRRLLLDLLSKQRMGRDAAAIRTLFEELLEPLLTAGGGEAVQNLSVPFGGRVMMRIAGLPEADAPRWRRWIKDMVMSGFSFTNQNERGVGLAACYPELLAYLDHHIDDRAAADDQPDDVLTRVVTARVDDAPLTRTIRRMIVFSVVSGGMNTMVNFLSNTLLSLARNPSVFRAIRSDRELITTTVEESLRRDSPSMYLTRVCGDDISVSGHGLPDGDRVLLGLASANRDETTYAQPTEFRLDRDAQPAHVAFGWGAHLCVGAPVVRQAGATMLDTLLDHVAEIAVEPGTEPTPYLSPQGNGLDELHVQLVPRAR